MALEVGAALNAGARVAIEAPTGTGKSLAYLIPGILAAEAQGVPLVISTHSKALQDQLLEKDLPLAQSLLVPKRGNKPLPATTVKGQENYVCLRKLHELIDVTGPDTSLEERFGVAFLASFTAVSRLAELERVPVYLRKKFPSLNEQTDWIRSHRTTTIGP
jgi:ATP-dependent DNA helicase DinG